MNTLMMSVGGLVEATARANLERDFGMPLPRPRAERLFDNAGIGEKVRPGIFGRLAAAFAPLSIRMSFRRAQA